MSYKLSISPWLQGHIQPLKTGSNTTGRSLSMLWKQEAANSGPMLQKANSHGVFVPSQSFLQ